MLALLDPIRIGALECANRVVMSPMTRHPAPGGVPNDIMRAYYARRVSVGIVGGSACMLTNQN